MLKQNPEFNCVYFTLLLGVVALILTDCLFSIKEKIFTASIHD